MEVEIILYYTSLHTTGLFLKLQALFELKELLESFEGIKVKIKERRDDTILSLLGIEPV